MSLEVIFLGTGTSQGVPMIACPCAVCHSTDPRDNRLRSSILLKWNDRHVIVDTGPDFRQQMLRIDNTRLDAVLFTHGHKDHTAGLDDIRAYNYAQKSAIDVYLDDLTEDVVRREYAYIFADFKYPGIPEVNLHRLTGEPFQLYGREIIPIHVMHYKLPVWGFRIGDFTYITDANYISELELEKIKGSKVLVINALRQSEKHISHFTLEEAIELVKPLGIPQIYFTHISHQLGLTQDINPSLPQGMELAYDGLHLSFD